jgi:TolB protein
LTRDGALSLSPKWGPKGDRFTYTSFLKRYPDVYLVNLKSGDRARIAAYPGLNTGAAISPDGRSVALVLSKDGRPELYVQDLATKRLSRLTDTPMSAKSSPSWSPDGGKIVFASGHIGRPHLFIVSRSGGALQRLTRKGIENVAPDWGVNGQIAYCTKLGARYHVAVIDPASGESVTVSPADADYEDPAWARDGRHIACTRTAAHRSSVYILDTLGDPPLALVDGRGDWYSPDWSP